MALIVLLKVFEVILKNLKKRICTLESKDTIVNILVTFKVAHNFF